MQSITLGTCRMMLVKRAMQKLFFPDIQRPKRQLLHPQHAKHHPGHLQDDAGEAGDAKDAFFYNSPCEGMLPPCGCSCANAGHNNDDAVTGVGGIRRQPAKSGHRT